MFDIKKRKNDHIRICIEKEVQAKTIKTGFEDVFFIHKALPEISLDEIDTSMEFFDRKLSVPIFIESMTGGIEKASKINIALAKTAERFGLAMGVGSQRIAIEEKNMESNFIEIRNVAPKAFLIANLGASQLVEGYSLKEIIRAVEMIEANALSFHLNSLHEAIQINGNTSYKGIIKKIEEIAKIFDLPVIVKETGAGISGEEAKRLGNSGIKGINVAGAGGTSWAAVESYRAQEIGDKLYERIGKTFWDWGIPTTVSIVEVRKFADLKIIASGGIRSGLDVAKAIALGADAAGIALPLLKPAIEGTLDEFFKIIIEELRISMFLVGAQKIPDLLRTPLVLTGLTADWLQKRGINPENYARRCME